jgi:peptide deformylase
VSLLPIHVLGSPILREETTLVTEFGAELEQLIDDMYETMYAAQGVGLAAPQIGRRERLAVIHCEDVKLVLINPEIVERDGNEKAEEACLSIPEIFGSVPRATRILVRAQDKTGEPVEIESHDYVARCIQHEVDHLHGKLFIDYLSYLKRRAALAQWELYKKDYPDFIKLLRPIAVRSDDNTDS